METRIAREQLYSAYNLLLAECFILSFNLCLVHFSLGSRECCAAVPVFKNNIMHFLYCTN